jgi:transcriptional regulator with XRE-family HTH domain
MTVADNIRRLLDESGMSASAASKKAGLPRDAISDILKGKSAHPRADTIAKIARAFEVDPGAILTGQVRRPAESRLGAEQIELPIRFDVAAGLWKEVEDFHNQLEPMTSSVPQAPAFNQFPQWLERVVGDSMDRLVPPGSLIHVVDAIAMEYQPREDDLVVVERTRAQGSLIERSLKQVTTTAEGLELWPRSHNKRWDKPLTLSAGDGLDDEVVQVVGLVIRAYMSFVGRE